MDRGAGACAPQAEPGRATSAAGLVHRAAIVGSAGEVVDVLAAHLEEGLRAGDLPVLAVPPDTADAVRRALGLRADAVGDDPRIVLLGARAPDAMAVVARLLEQAAGTGSGRLRVLAQPQYRDDPRRWREVRRYEAAVNALVATAPLTVLCAHDRGSLPAEALDTARATHRELVADGAVLPNPAYQDPEACLRGIAAVREPVEAGDPVYAVDGVPTLPVLRRDLQGVLAAVVPDADLVADLHLAVSEVAANAFRHGRPPVSARVWADDTAVVCTITDSGDGHDALLAGFVPAHGEDLSAGGMGLWLARKLWDSVDLLPGPTGGLRVRLATTLPPAPAGRGAA